MCCTQPGIRVVRSIQRKVQRSSKALVVALVASLAVVAGGCSKPATSTPDGSVASSAESRVSPPTTNATKVALDTLNSDTPESAVGKFLEAIRAGNDRVAETMFTDLARERIKELDLQVAPRGSDTAKYEIGKAELLGDDGARVPCKWSDIDSEGKIRVDEMTWMLRKQPQGWRVAGMAAVVLEGEDPLLLDFEEPKETLQKLERLREEIARRSTPHSEEANPMQNQENPQEAIRR